MVWMFSEHRQDGIPEHDTTHSGYGTYVHTSGSSSRLLTHYLDRPNWQDWGGRWGRRTAFMRNLKVILEELDLRYSMPVQPILLPRGMNHSESLRMSVPRGMYSHESLGNAGSFQSSDHLRAPTRSLRPGGDTF